MDNYNYQSYNKPPKRKRGPSYIIVAIIASIIGGLISSYIAPNYLYGRYIPIPAIFTNQNQQPQQQIQISTREDITSVTAVAKKAIGSVVGITTVQVQRDWIFEKEVPGVGSGVIVDSNGYILTNSHVIADGLAKRITVLFENGDNLEGTVLWFDPTIDLAIVKVNITNAHVADFGDSDKLEIGELAVAIGNPLGLEFQRSVTSGVISGLHRSVRTDQRTIIEDLIQTDASINFGNSGGPLLNSEGKVIGINTAKISGGEGLGFSIPINLAKPIVEEVIKNGSFNNVYIGFRGVEVELYERQYGVKLKAESGTVITEVFEGSAAAAANLRPLDVIVEFDGEPVDTMISLRKMLYKYKLGDGATLTINRDGEISKVEIVFKEF